MKSMALTAVATLTLLCLTPMKSNSKTLDPHGIQFIPFQTFSTFKKSPGNLPGESVLTSPEIRAQIPWTELIASWNAETPTGGYLKVEVRALHPDRATKWFTMGMWSGDPAGHPRESLRGQKDADGDVNTDTLVLSEPAERVQVRVTLGGEGRSKPKLKFLSLSLLDVKAAPPCCRQTARRGTKPLHLRPLWS